MSNRFGVWPWIIAVVLISIGAFQVFRVNRPLREKPLTEQVRYTYGPVVNGPITIEPRSYLAFKIELNRRTDLAGNFRTAARSESVAARVMSADEFELWRNGSEYKHISQTGYIPGGKISLVLDPGAYYLIFDNLHSDKPQTIEANFEVE